MAALHSNQHAPTQSFIARSPSVLKAYTPSRLYSVASRGDFYRPGESTGDKRRLRDDGNSTTSKASRCTYNSRYPSRTYGQQNRIVRNTPSIQKQELFKTGTIIRGDHVEEAYKNGTTLMDKSMIHVPGHNPICKKARFFIVLAGHAMSYVCLPIFTHNGNGTRNKPRPEEFVSIRDHRATIEVQPQSGHEPLMTLEMSGMELKASSVVHLAYPTSRSYELPVEVIGRLTATSTNRCIQLFRRYMPVEVSERSPASGTGVLINAGVSVSRALTNLRFEEFTHLFRNMSWSKVTCLTERELGAKGIISQTDRQQILAVFDQIAKAIMSGPDWTVSINNDTLAKKVTVTDKDTAVHKDTVAVL
ncbi:hypothetical protein EPUS_00673 [Endocarpon pusillum Z07020]|uniref:DUF6590 domain-containing protein n=1 Tax=Endocarpon pusillum (strain Z07020 / HMAS-L-300199) TaxID=1263415 RepID=U1GQC4_ENDPU|nr:uncharacterized protein EPUS_00673 [Endocarpon pusillum Z07020]ERF74543.1 hypothetical protein EPUS_00673 [Endocarpon pusillum Z07020]